MLHAKLSASGSHRWAFCAASTREEAKFKERTSTFAQEGTAAHELSDICFEKNHSPYDYIGQQLPGENAITVDQEMADSVQLYIDYINMLPGTRMIEERVDFSRWVPEGFGTSDCIVINDLEKSMHVVDLKYGKGKKVYAEDNTQGILYALGAYAEFGDYADIETITVVIVQPRLDHIDEWTISTADLLKWGDWLSEQAAKTQDPDATHTPGESQCMFCRAKPTCPANKKMVEDVILSHFDEFDEPTRPKLLPEETLADIQSKAKMIKSYLAAVEEYIKEQISSGQEFPGYKLVRGRSTRSWAHSEDEIAAAMIQTYDLTDEDLYSKKFITPPQAEKLVGKSGKLRLQDLIVKSEGAPTLTTSADPRESIQVNCDSFADFD